jgi:hypothetical protein
MGMTITARKYDLQACSPFQGLDILNLQPVVKHSIPICTEASDLMEAGKIRLAEVPILHFLGCHVNANSYIWELEMFIMLFASEVYISNVKL